MGVWEPGGQWPEQTSPRGGKSVFLLCQSAVQEETAAGGLALALFIRCLHAACPEGASWGSVHFGSGFVKGRSRGFLSGMGSRPP